MAGLEEDARRHCRAVDEVAWTDFFGGALSPRHATDQWGLFIDQLLLRQAFEQQLRAELEWRPDIALEGRFSSGWTPLAEDGAEIPFYISGAYDDYYCTVDFVAEPTVHLHLASDQLMAEADFGDISASDHDLYDCARGLTGMFGGFFSPVLREVAAGIFYGALSDYEFDIDLSGVDFPGWDCDSSDSTLRCTTPVELPPLRTGGDDSEILGVLTLDHVTGEADGFVIGGSLAVSYTPPFDLIGDFAPFEFGMSRCCTDLWYGATLLLDGAGALCEDTPTIINDPLNVYRLEELRDGWRIRLDFSRWEAFWARPYPALVHVLSAGGVATFLLDPGSTSSVAELEGWGAACAAERFMCGLEHSRGDDIIRRPDRDPDPLPELYDGRPRTDLGEKHDLATSKKTPGPVSESATSEKTTSKSLESESLERFDGIGEMVDTSRAGSSKTDAGAGEDESASASETSDSSAEAETARADARATMAR
jgi:hypothetical protein